MSSSSPGRPYSLEKLLELIDLSCEGRLNTAHAMQLEEILDTGLEAQQRYIEYVDVQSAMREFAELEYWGNDLEKLISPELLQQRPQAGSRVRLWASVMSIVAVVCLMLGGTLWLALSRPPRIAGTIVAVSSKLELASGRLLSAGDMLPTGDSFVLREGFVLLQTEHGAKVHIQSPAMVRLARGDLLQMDSGQLRAHVPSTAVGFTVVTPNAKVIDFGTEFLVSYERDSGTDVSVREGVVDAVLRSEAGPSQTLRLTAGRSAIIDQEKIEEIGYREQSFGAFDQQAGVISRVDGPLHVAANPPSDLGVGVMPTEDYLLIVAEKQRLMLTDELKVMCMQGEMTFPAGTVLSSYLMHFDPGLRNTRPPIGAVSFDRAVTAIISDSTSLSATDSILGSENTDYPAENFRGLEFGEDLDICELSADRKSVAFNLDLTEPNYLDQCRILIVHDPVIGNQ
ncbi:FecR family protein [Calycomorphotria hydatis]|uniref:FecR protein n=1 Tax=Calycomorphotria hydatis TaxID=2528027 RepID=A0A517T6A1_9PLAN|nr:FecR domain-containing protein [Calycomorphotria hydatis]QDT63878.1 FecR protein [Calycomorphotria hydatis]